MLRNKELTDAVLSGALPYRKSFKSLDVNGVIWLTGAGEEHVTFWGVGLSKLAVDSSVRDFRTQMGKKLRPGRLTIISIILSES